MRTNENSDSSFDQSYTLRLAAMLETTPDAVESVTVYSPTAHTWSAPWVVSESLSSPATTAFVPRLADAPQVIESNNVESDRLAATADGFALTKWPLAQVADVPTSPLLEDEAEAVVAEPVSQSNQEQLATESVSLVRHKQQENTVALKSIVSLTVSGKKEPPPKSAISLTLPVSDRSRIVENLDASINNAQKVVAEEVVMPMKPELAPDTTVLAKTPTTEISPSAVAVESSARTNASNGMRRGGGPSGSTLVLLLGALVVVGLVIALVWFFSQGKTTANQSLLTQIATRSKYDHIVLEQGEVESSSNVEIRCEVKSRNTSGTQILSVIAEGTQVKKGDIVVRLDSSALERDRDQQKITCNNSESVCVQAENTLKGAEIAKKEYLEGTYTQEKQKAESERYIAEQNLRTAQLSFKSGERLAAKGIVTSLQLEGDKFAMQKAQNELDAANTKLEVLEKYTKPKIVTQLDSDIESAKAKWQAEKSSFELELKKLKDIEDQIAKCELRAPQDGTVVYANVFSSRGGSAEFVVEAGANVREGQVIIRLPDPAQMQVKAKVNESRVTLLKAGMPVAVRLDALSDQTFRGVVTRVNQYAEPTSFFSSQVKEYATFIRILDPPPQIRPGLTAEVQIYVEQRTDALQLPVQAIFEHGGAVYCVKAPVGNAKGQIQQIRIGSSNDKFVTIEEGLNAGDVVLLGPKGYLDAEKIPLPPVQETAKLFVPGAVGAEVLDKNKTAPSKNAAVTSPGGSPMAVGSGDAGQRPSGGRPGNFNPDQLFASRDTDGDGKLSASELQELPEAFRSRLMQADTNGDGAIDRAEFNNRPRGGGPGGPPSGPGGSP